MFSSLVFSSQTDNRLLIFAHSQYELMWRLRIFLTRRLLEILVSGLPQNLVISQFIRPCNCQQFPVAPQYEVRKRGTQLKLKMPWRLAVWGHVLTHTGGGDLNVLFWKWGITSGLKVGGILSGKFIRETDRIYLGLRVMPYERSCVINNMYVFFTVSCWLAGKICIKCGLSVIWL